MLSFFPRTSQLFLAGLSLKSQPRQAIGLRERGAGRLLPGRPPGRGAICQLQIARLALPLPPAAGHPSGGHHHHPLPPSPLPGCSRRRQAAALGAPRRSSPGPAEVAAAGCASATEFGLIKCPQKKPATGLCPPAGRRRPGSPREFAARLPRRSEPRARRRGTARQRRGGGLGCLLRTQQQNNLVPKLALLGNKCFYVGHQFCGDIHPWHFFFFSPFHLRKEKILLI